MWRADSAIRASQSLIDVAVIGLAPAAILVLPPPQPVDGLAKIGLPRVLPGKGQAGNGTPGAIDVIATPTPPPTAIGLLGCTQVIDTVTQTETILTAPQHT